MSVRPFRDIKRKKTKKINVGDIEVGGDSTISVQSMTNTLTTDIKETINQINKIVEAGADIVRVSCPDQESSLALKKIISQVKINIPTYNERDLPKALATLPAVKPGSRELK